MHQSNTHSPEVTFHHEPAGDEQVKKIIRTTVILSVITIIELALGFVIYFLHKSPDYSHALVLFIKGVIVILSLAKAFYIVGVFMHLGDEVRNLIMTIVVPLLLFVWFIAAFLWDGDSWLNLRNTDAGHRPYPEQQIVAP
ncbi:MAG TPA: cytochrome C oxidase subunit IV family protein, partial [Chitinophagaceae bacterium]|nr:cytochrome C oxidase subunit IV family protein [Chitinophagaceae bacterium]